ncbi:MAG: hypothetical protein IJI67_03050 [Clostridia bacterium]|nr:hypothetical protein [Clostridia bacterium]
MDLSNTKAIYNYILSQPLPAAWQTPQSLKKSYAAALGAAKDYQAAIKGQMKQLGSSAPLTAAPAYKNLLALYNRQYAAQAALAAARGKAAANKADAGYSNSYAGAASEQAHSAHMAQRGAQVPKLMAAAAKARGSDQSAAAAGAKALQNQRDLRGAALQKLFEAQLGGIEKETAARREAYKTLLGSLADVYDYQYDLENPTGSSSGSSGRRSSGRRSSSRKSSSKSTKKKTGSQKTMTLEDYDAAYSEAIRKYPKLRNVLKTAGEYTRRGGDIREYQNYINRLIDQYY